MDLILSFMSIFDLRTKVFSVSFKKTDLKIKKIGRSLITCIHKQMIAIGTTRSKTCHVTSVITATMPISCIVDEANPPSLKGMSRSTTL